MTWWDRTNLRTILTTETDADSPGSEELLSQFRENFEALIMFLFDTGIVSTVDSCVTDTITDAELGASTNEHIQRTLLITNGTAIGNMYKIDGNTATTITCTGDDLAADGVGTGTTFKILYDIISNVDGHDHDGVNSAEVVLADSQVTQAKLKTTTGSVTSVVASWQQKTLPGGEYGFYPQQKGSSGNNFVAACNPTTARAVGTYATIIELYDSAGGGVWAQQRYVQSSGEVHWVFILRDKTTKNVLSVWQAPDHPCFGNGGDPTLLEQPHLDYDPAVHELIVVNPTKAEVKAIRKAAKTQKKDFTEILAADYELDESAEVSWPIEDVTTDLDEDLDTGKYKVIKGKIPKPPDVKCYKLKKK
jgi:hypothetical protein